MAKEFTVGVEGMSCAHCVKRVHDEIEAISGVHKVDVSLEERSATVSADDIYRDEVTAAIERAGYRVRL
jgi:copper ion binding protein